MAQEWLAENIKLPIEGSLRYQMEKRNIEEEQVFILSLSISSFSSILTLDSGPAAETGRGRGAEDSRHPAFGKRIRRAIARGHY
jgi:hypothetical protein